MVRLRLDSLRTSLVAMSLAVASWAAGCAGPQPLIEPTFAARTYTPGRIALLPPDIFLVYDQLGDNDPEKSAALGRAVTEHAVGLLADNLHRRGYDVDLAARWDGVHGPDGALLMGGDELSWLANSILQFANSPAGAARGPIRPDAPIIIAPELAWKVGAATQSDAILYVNIKGVAVSAGKRTAQIFGFVVIIAFMVMLALLLSQGGDRRGGSRAPSTASGGRSVPSGGARTVAPAASSAPAVAPGGVTSVTPVPRGRGSLPQGRGGGRSYGGSNVGIGVGVVVPLGGPTHTHGGQVADQDDELGGDDVYLSMTLVNARDGRVLWHIRENLDADPSKPSEVERFIRSHLDLIPPSLAPAR